MTTSFMVFLVLVPIALLAGAGLAVFLIWKSRHCRDDFDRGPFFWFGVVAAVVTTIGLVGALFGSYPYGMAYHSYRPVSGTVSQISSRFVSAGGDNGDGTSQKYAVTFKGSPQIYGITDTRASLVKVGQHLRITCIRRHQWGGGVDGYDCRWDQ